MKKIISIVSIILAFVMLTSAASAGTVTRTMDKDYLRIGETETSINVTLTGIGVTDQEMPGYGAIETLPSNIIVSNVTDHTDAINDLNDNTKWSFVTLNGNVLIYNIKLDTSASVGTYPISGTFVDSNKNIGVISPSGMSIRILEECTNDPVCYYNTNSYPGIQRDEVINAVADYFDLNNHLEVDLSLADVLKVVRAYLGL